jgi:hypothetical protein
MSILVVIGEGLYGIQGGARWTVQVLVQRLAAVARGFHAKKEERVRAVMGGRQRAHSRMFFCASQDEATPVEAGLECPAAETISRFRQKRQAFIWTL